MDTKYQNKIFSGLLLVIAIICLSFAFLTSFEKKLNYDENNISYFHNSPDISKMAIRYAKNLQRYFIYYKDFDIDAATEKLDEIDKYITTGQIEPNKRNYNVEIRPFDSGYIVEDEEENYEGDSIIQPESLYNFSIENVTVDTLLEKQKNLSDAINNYNSIKAYLNNNSDFHFILYNNKVGHIIATNAEDFTGESCYDVISISDPLFNISFNGETLINAFKNEDLSCQISIPVTTSNNIKMLMNNLHVQLDNNKIFSSPVVTFAFFVIAVAIFLLLFIFDRETLNKAYKKMYGIFSKIPLIVSIPVIVIIVGTSIHTYLLESAIITQAIIYGNVFRLLVMVAGSIFSVVFVGMFIAHIVTIVIDKSAFFTIPDVAFLIKGTKDIKLALEANKKFFALVLAGIQFIIVILACVLLIMLINYVMFMPYIWAIWFVIGLLVIFYNISAVELRLRYYIKEMAAGHMEVVPEQKGLFTNSINQLNTIRGNFQKNLDETLKSERLKTDLITNVSHDLKTPLTSIINYVELLSSLPDNSDVANEYIDVIKNKSRRLKTLIDDLFEASKLSSGQMKLNRMDSDIVSLLEQTLGELSYKIEESGIEFVVTNTLSPIIVNIDGERMWRVFDNLINNILKYSPKNSRAYIDISENENQVKITFKNVANYHMEFNEEELFERFKRGDIARTTEGSGLGLSIAKSIVELHGGTMNIVTDGDLFKIIVTLIKNKENEE